MERLFLDLFDAVPDAMIIVDGHGRIAMANHHAERMFGYPRDGLPGIDVEALIPADTRHRHRAHRADYMSRPRVRPMGATGQTLVGLRSDGSQFPVEIALSPVESHDGMRYLASIRDISETQRTQQALVRAGYDTLVARIGQLALESNDEANVLEQAAQLLAKALDIDTVAIVFLRPDRESADIRASVGLSTGDHPGSPIDAAALAKALAVPAPLQIADLAAQPADAFPLRPSSAGSGVLMPFFARHRATGALLVHSRQPNRFDHDAVHLLQSVANLLAALGQRRHSEEQLAHSQRLDALGQLTGGIAHDFNNLLTVLSGSLQLLEMENEGRAEAQELIATALRSVTRGAELTAKLLAFARRQRLMPQATDTRALLRDTETMLRRTLGDSIRLRVECEGGLPAAYADQAQLDAAIINLALNARDAMPRGGEIRIEARRALIDAETASADLPVGYYVLTSIIDTGTGMAPEILARAMEPFFTTKEASHGSGLGLSMVYGFAKQSGGHLHIASRLGHGTRVDLYLPVARALARADPAVDNRRGNGGDETVLVVEDDPAVRDIVVAFLRTAGYRVHAVADAMHALDKLTKDPAIAVLFSDVMLGNGHNGRELAQEARQFRPDLPVLLTTGYAEDSAVDDRFDLLRKPYRREQLLSAIRRVLERTGMPDAQ